MLQMLNNPITKGRGNKESQVTETIVTTKESKQQLELRKIRKKKGLS